MMNGEEKGGGVIISIILRSILKLKEKLLVCIRLFINLFTKSVEHQLMTGIIYLRILLSSGRERYVNREITRKPEIWGIR